MPSSSFINQSVHRLPSSSTIPSVTLSRKDRDDRDRRCFLNSRAVSATYWKVQEIEGHHQMKTTQWWHAWFKVSIIITIIIIIILICITSTDTFYRISALNSAHTIIILTCITDTDISIISTWVNIIGFSIIVWIKTVAEQFLYDNRYIKSLLISINTISTVIKQLTHDTYHTINHSHIIISTMFIYT